MEIDVYAILADFYSLLLELGLYDYGWITATATDVFFAIVSLCTIFAPLVLSLLLIKWIVRLNYDN